MGVSKISTIASAFAAVAWLAGWKATPLPIGWTPVEPTHSNFVYFGLLALFAVLFLAGLKERKVWPMLAAIALGPIVRSARHSISTRGGVPRSAGWSGRCAGHGRRTVRT